MVPFIAALNLHSDGVIMSEERQMYIRCIGLDGAFYWIRPYLNLMYGFPNDSGTQTYCDEQGTLHPDQVNYKDQYFIPVRGNGELERLATNPDIVANENVEFWTVQQYIDSLTPVE